MDTKRWLRLKELFRQAIERPLANRDAFIALNCNDVSLCAELRKLLELHDVQSDFLEPPNQASPSNISIGPDPVIGKCLNGFHMLRRIGEGGMGIVYEARQENPNRMAAVKLLQPSCNTEQNIWRFKNESETLSKLQHPGIAHVYASGSFDFGNGLQPWFAMELVEGQPLHHFCQSHQLDTIEKLQLLLSICDAVQHAHEHGVIHRDLKPANILVETRVRDTEQGGSIASPKIVDFGLARVETQDRMVTMQTATGNILGTLSYMSPERFSGDRSAIDVRCDVYALGTIGYEMLAGRLPHESRSSSVAEAIRCIEQDEPESLGQLDPRFRGDIEVIFAKAIEKDLSRRYASVTFFASDIRRYLNHEPVLARPASQIYRMRKFVRRNRVLVGGVATTLLALVFGMVLVSREARKAHGEAAKSAYEADKATAINNFITNDFLMKLLSAAQSGKTNERLPVSELVGQASSNISTMFASKPKIEAAVRNEVGTIYYNLGEFEQALVQYRQAMEYWEAALGPDHPDTLKTINNLGQTCLCLGRAEEAESLLRRALEGRLRALGESDAQTLSTMNNMAALLQSMKRLDEAEGMFRRALSIQQKSLGIEHKTTLASMANLGSTLASRGQYKEALELHQSVYDTCCRTLGQENMTTLHAGSRLGQTMLQLGNAEEARIMVMSVLESFERMHGPAHPDTIIERRLLARIHKSLGDYSSAKNQLQLALDSVQKSPEQRESTAKKIRAELRVLETASQPH